MAAGDHRARGDHQVERRRDEHRRGRRGAGQHGAVGADRGRDREPLRRPGSRRRSSRHDRHGRHLDRRLDRDRRPRELHHRLRDRVGGADPDPDGRHPHDRRRRRLDRLDRQGRHAAGRPAKRRRAAWPRLLRPRRGPGHGDRRQPGARPDQSRLFPRRPDAARRRRRAPRDRAARRASSARTSRRPRSRSHGSSTPT